MKDANQMTTTRTSTGLLAAAVAGILLATAAPASAEYGYSYFRTVEGYADLDSAESAESLEVVANQPILAGDSLRVGSGSRVEVVLADGTIVRFGDTTEARFDSLAWTTESADTVTRLLLDRGSMQLLIDSGSSSGGDLELETSNALLYLRSPGEYRVTSSPYGDTEVVVRNGFAEATTDRGSAIFRDGEAARIEGEEWPRIDVVEAGRYDSLERWGEQLDAEARLAYSDDIDPELHYRAAPMNRSGVWMDIGGRRAWRPYVAAGWRPYQEGSWVPTPAGLTWVSSEPWGWVPYHYGTWDLVPGHGWVWFAGNRYAPAWVYWYWGPTHVAWVPSGYYTGFYAPHGQRYGYGPRLGVYGWAGGGWSYFAEWTFCPTRYFGRRGHRERFVNGREAARHASFREVPRGVIATDTRSIDRAVLGDPTRVEGRLRAAHARNSNRELGDVSDFVARRRDAAPAVLELTRPQALASMGRSVPAETAKTRAIRVQSEERFKPRLDTRLETREGRPRRDESVRDRAARSESPSRQRSGWWRSQTEPRAGSRGRPEVERSDRDETRRVFERGRYGRPATGSPATRPPSAGAPEPRREPRTRAESPPRGTDRPVVQRVIERVRGKDAPPGKTERSTRPPERRQRTERSERSERSRTSSGARSGSSSERSKGRSSASRGDSSRGKRAEAPSRKQSSRRKTARRKPPTP